MFPTEPKKGYPIQATNSEMLRWMKSEVITSVQGGRLVQGPNGKALIIEKDSALPSLLAKSQMWTVTKTGQTEDDPPFPIFKVKGGIAVIQGTRVLVADVAELEATSETGYVCLKTVRDTDSRALDLSVDPNPEIVWIGPDPPTSQEYEEFTILAEYLDDEKVRQCRHGEICSQESMFFENAEFKLLPFQANSRNSYDLP